MSEEKESVIKNFDLHKSSVGVWILARLYDEPYEMSMHELAKTLCDQSFDMMKSDDEFVTTVNTLKDKEWIVLNRYSEFSSGGGSGSITITDNSSRSINTGYKITTLGILAFRRYITTPYFKAFEYSDKLKFPDDVIETLQHFEQGQEDLGRNLVMAVIHNAPLILDTAIKLIQVLKSAGLM